MKQFIAFLLLLSIGNQLLADETKVAPKEELAKEQGRNEEAPPPKTLEEAHQRLEQLLPADSPQRAEVLG